MSPRTIYAEIETGRLTAHRFGGSRGALRVAEGDRIAWEENSRNQNGAPPRQSFRQSPEAADLIAKHLHL